LLLADDLTGACDAGAAFLHCGSPVRVWLGAAAVFAVPEPVQAFNTASRALEPEQAAQAVSRAAAALAGIADSFLFKKIDSAGRGPIAAELLAAQQVLAARAILLTPAFPAMGRTVRNGILHIQDPSGQSQTVELAGLFPAAIRDRIACIGSAAEISAALEAGKAVLVCDSQTQAELEALARAAAPLPGLLFAGSAGLAQGLASLQVAAAAPEPAPRSARTLIICGTPHPVTAVQLAAVDGARAATSEILRIRCESGDDERVRAAFEAVKPQALILTGGDTALLVAQALTAHSFILRGELAPGIPWGFVQGGAADGRIVMTKSGSFGAPSALDDLLITLTGKE
jgi:uncharacterized protein YgbK (DUF1537 family)